ncbi:MAG TPA: cytochrome c nitrite reductase small subunit [Vicinamibacterales bacterium]
MRLLPVITAAAIGVMAALGGYTFLYARGYSYLTNDPKACANCHIMENHYSSWLKSSHRSVAVCNDCHTPPGLIPKYMTKGENGFRHSFAFTTGWFPEPLRITDRDRAVTEKACRKCHAEIVDAIEGSDAMGRLSCTRCHSEVGHLE